jgi:hypothetical protein
VTPAARAASSKSRTFRSWSTTMETPGLFPARAMTLSIFSLVTTGDVMRTFSTPASTITSASLTFAAQTPTAPFAICFFARIGHLWVLVWGRSFAFFP